jgi:hypothetical protein
VEQNEQVRRIWYVWQACGTCIAWIVWQEGRVMKMVLCESCGEETPAATCACQACGTHGDGCAQAFTGACDDSGAYDFGSPDYD